MQNHKTDYVLTDENAVVKIALLSVIGDREEQQDCAGVQLNNNEGLVVVCDGMGGHKGGQLAGELAVRTMLSRYAENFPCNDPRTWLLEAAADIDLAVSCLHDRSGEKLNAGSTMVAAYIADRSLYWLSVGDSRLYIFRDGELVRATADHNYQSVLNRQLQNGLIDKDAYDRQIGQGEALVSFLGVNGLPYIESNDLPFGLKSGDRLLLATDGLYRLISDEGICSIINNFTDISEMVHALEMKARRCAGHVARDNMTVAAITVK